MNRYPLWKNLLILGVIVLSTIIALPNCFGDDEAVQVSRTDGVAMDAPALEQVRTMLMDGGIEYLVRRHRRHVRARACRGPRRSKSALATLLTKEFPNYVAALTLAPRTPGWLKALGLKPMLLGLDLRGGVHFLYQVDLDSAVAQFLETYESDRAHAVPRSARSATTCASRARRLQVALVEPADMDRAEEIIRQLDAGDQLLQLGQLTSRLIIDRAQFDGRPGFNVTPDASGDPRAPRFRDSAEHA